MEESLQLLPEFQRSSSSFLTKGLDEVALILEAAGGGYFQYGQVGLDQELPGLSNPQVNNILHGRGANDVLETSQAASGT